MKLKVEYIPIDSIKPYENNAKIHTPEQIEQIKASINEFGMNDPIGIWGKDNLIVEGHGRLMACKELGYKEVPIIRLDELTDDQRKAYTLIHNQTTMNTGFDIDILNEELANIEFDMSDFGFELEFDDIEEEQEIVEDEVPEIPEEPKAKLGDIYQLGNHRLMCGDSTSIDDINNLLDGEIIDLVFTDPPYGNGTSGKYGRGQLGIRTIIGDENLNVFEKFIKVIPTDEIIYFLQWRTLAQSLKCITDKGLKINTVGVWDKKNAGLNGAGGISEQWEAIIFAGNIKYKKFGGNVFNIAREQHKREDSPHPHQKPIKLLAEIFEFIDDSNNIFDGFGGSGSTLIACEQLNKNCYMMELDPHYVDVIIQRWENFTGEKAIKLNG